MKKTLMTLMAATMMTAGGFAAAPVKSHCNIKVVSYVFTGAPGSTFSYHGKSHAIPVSGQIELIADQKDLTYVLASGPMAIDAEAKGDAFGSVTVPLGTTGGGSSSTTVTTTTPSR
jgi:hypothetical protein